jgi:hypothetical protein
MIGHQRAGGYKRNEVDLQIAPLNTLLTGLQDKNKAVIRAQVTLSTSSVNRKKVISDTTAVYGTGKMVKKYITFAYGTTSDQYVRCGLTIHQVMS